MSNLSLAASPRFKRHWWRRGISLAVVAFALVRLLAAAATPPASLRPVEGTYQVRSVIDGDTLLLANGARVRLQGIDTPETVKPGHPVENWGPEASAFTKKFIDDASGPLRLTFSAERIDRYGRWLAFAWSGDLMLNEELVRAGYAEARLAYRYAGRMKRRLAEAQDAARREGRGMWSAAPTPVNP